MLKLIGRRCMIQEPGEGRRVSSEAAREFRVAHVLPTTGKLGWERGQIPRELIEMAGATYFGILIPGGYRDLGLGAYGHRIFRGMTENSGANHLRCTARQGGSVMGNRTGARHGDCHG
jgi:hypothetical protein